MVHRNGTRDASGTLLMMVLACTSWNVMPRNPGVSKVLVMAARSNRAGCALPLDRLSPEFRDVSQRMWPSLEYLFELFKYHLNLGWSDVVSTAPDRLARRGSVADLAATNALPLAVHKGKVNNQRRGRPGTSARTSTSAGRWRCGLVDG